jgi:hypothetical protein
MLVTLPRARQLGLAPAPIKWPTPSSHAGEAYVALGRVGVCHPNNKRDVGEQPVTRADDGRSGGATLHVAVTAPPSGAGPEQGAEPRPRPGGSR